MGQTRLSCLAYVHAEIIRDCAFLCRASAKFDARISDSASHCMGRHAVFPIVHPAAERNPCTIAKGCSRRAPCRVDWANPVLHRHALSENLSRNSRIACRWVHFRKPFPQAGRKSRDTCFPDSSGKGADPKNESKPRSPTRLYTLGILFEGHHGSFCPAYRSALIILC